MSAPENHPQELAQLLSKLLEERLDQTEQSRLAFLLRESQEARRFYLGYVETHALLRAEFGAAPWTMNRQDAAVLGAIASSERPLAESTGLPLPSPGTTPRKGRLRTVGLALAGSLFGAAAACLLAVAVWPESPPPPPPAVPVIAHLTDLAEVQWPEGRTPPSLAAELRPGPLRLLAGTVQLAFTSGAVVTLTGPAELELITPLRAFLRNGQMVSYVPPRARGFTVLSPHGQFVDLGTEFAVRVKPAGETDVQVLAGEVQMAPNALDPGAGRSLTAGYGARLETTNGAVLSRITQQPLLLDDFEVPDTADLNSNLSARQQGRLAPLGYTSLDADAAAEIRQGRLVIPFAGQTRRNDPVSRVLLDHDFTELVGHHYTISFKVRLPETVSVPAEIWLAFVLQDEGRRPSDPSDSSQPSVPLAYEATSTFGVMFALTHWQVGVRSLGRTVQSKRVFAPSEAAGPYQVLLSVDETAPDGPRFDLKVNGVPVVVDFRLPLRSGRRLAFHSWCDRANNPVGASIDDLCVSVESNPAQTSTTPVAETR